VIRLLPATPEIARAVVSGQGPIPVEHLPDWPHEDTVDALRPLADHPDLTGEGTFLVVEDGLVVGECGWSGPPVDGEVLVGYGVARSARGRGVGTEAVRQLLAWVQAQGARSVRAEVLPGNEASLRLLARLGFREAGVRDGHRQLVWAHG